MPIADNRARRMDDENKKEAGGMFVVLKGKQKGESFKLKGKQTSIGTDAECGIVLIDDQVSGVHASVKIVQAGKETLFTITDLDSTNGTFLNNEESPIAKEELVDNDTIRMGGTELKFKAW